MCGLAAACAFIAGCSTAPDSRNATTTDSVAAASAVVRSTTTTITTTSTTTTTTISPTTVEASPGDPYAQPGWVAEENRRPGSTDWRIINDPADPVRDTPGAWVEGYADTTSATIGQTVTMFVDTPAATFTVKAFRMGWYDGLQARLVWQSEPTAGSRQPAASFVADTGMAEAPWTPSLTVDITEQWPPGAYLLKLESSGGGGHYVPLTIRHDAAAGDLLFMSAVTTWQAYNPWGDCTLYECFEPRRKFRAEVVSFDRPYAHSYAQGAADFPTHELPLLSFIEQQGFDVAYITNIDLHREPSLAGSRRALVSTGHDEYYSWPMRAGLVGALDAGRNIAFFGANAVYRNIRLEPGATGAPDRREVNYRVRDSGAGGDPQQVTVNWRESPLRKPEAEIVGIQYGCAEVRANMRLVNTSSWLYEGTGAKEGERLKNLVGVEFDELAPSSQTPPGVELLAVTPLTCRELTYQQVTAYHTRASGAGVFAAGTIDWSCGLDGTCPGIQRFEIVRGVTLNVLRVFMAGPAGETQPSRGNVSRYRTRMHEPVNGPVVVATTSTTDVPPTTTDPTTTVDPSTTMTPTTAPPPPTTV